MCVRKVDNRHRDHGHDVRNRQSLCESFQYCSWPTLRLSLVLQIFYSGVCLIPSLYSRSLFNYKTTGGKWCSALIFIEKQKEIQLKCEVRESEKTGEIPQTHSCASTYDISLDFIIILHLTSIQNHQNVLALSYNFYFFYFFTFIYLNFQLLNSFSENFC